MIKKLIVGHQKFIKCQKNQNAEGIPHTGNRQNDDQYDQQYPSAKITTQKKYYLSRHTKMMNSSPAQNSRRTLVSKNQRNVDAEEIQHIETHQNDEQ